MSAGTTHNNLLADSFPDAPTGSEIDFVAHSAALGANALKVADIAGLEAAVSDARGSDRTTVIVIETDPQTGTDAGGAWWNVPIAAVSSDPRVHDAHKKWRQVTEEDPP